MIPATYEDFINEPPGTLFVLTYNNNTLFNGIWFKDSKNIIYFSNPQKIRTVNILYRYGNQDYVEKQCKLKEQIYFLEYSDYQILNSELLDINLIFQQAKRLNIEVQFKSDQCIIKNYSLNITIRRRN